MEKRSVGYVTPVASTAFTSEVRFAFSGAETLVKFDYWRDNSEHHSALLFRGTRAFRYRGDAYCTVWEIQNAFDTLVEVRNSRWVNELRDAMSEAECTVDRPMNAHHYLIYLHSFGAVEVIASGWEAMAEQAGPWE